MTKITKNDFEFENMKYFRRNAHRVDIGTYGEKKDSATAAGYLAPQARVKAEHLASRVQYGTRVKINWSDVSKADLEADADLKFFGLGKKMAVGFNYEKAKDNKLELINLAINEGPLTKMLNQDAHGALKYFAETGNDCRICSEAWVVVDAELGEHFDAYGTAGMSVQAFGSNLDITVTGGKNGSQTITYSPGTTFAYLLYKVKKWTDKDKTQIENMEDDHPGMT